MKMIYEDTPVPAGTVLVFLPNDSTGTSFVGAKATVTKEFTGGYSIEVRVSDSHGGFIEESPVMGKSGPRFTIYQTKGFGNWFKEHGL